MIFFYLIVPYLIAMVPFLYPVLSYRKLFGWRRKLLTYLILPTLITLPTLFEYIEIIVVGGEVFLPVELLSVRILVVIAIITVVLLIYRFISNYIMSMIFIANREKTYFSTFHILNVVYLFALPGIDYLLPETLSIPWLSIITSLALTYSLISYLIYLALIFATYRLIGREWIWFIAATTSFFIVLTLSFIIGAPGATSIGALILIISALISLFLHAPYLYRKGTFKLRARRDAIIALLLISSLLIMPVYPLKDKGAIDDAWNNFSFEIETNASSFPIDISNVRLIDRSLARDFALSYRLPRISNYQLRIGTEDENIGLIDGKPAWVVPIYYTYAFTPEINYMVGYLYIHLDTPTFESMRFVEKSMKVAPGLYGENDLYLFALKLVPDGMIGEFYLIDPCNITTSPAWVVLLDRYTQWGIRVPYKVLVVGAEGDYKVFDWYEAKGKVPQIISRKALESMVLTIGSSIRNGLKDYFAKGFIWIPTSQDIQELLEDEFYHRSHHFLLGDWWGRDFYLAVRTSGGEESVATWIMINDTIELLDLRFYKGIGNIERGVNAPEKALEAMQGIIEGKVPYGATIRYPKLYRVVFNNNVYLVWVALVIQNLPGADKPLGVVWVDGSNPRIAGFVEYVYGESHDIFMDRLHNTIEASYKGWQSGNETTLVSSFINGTIIRKNWALLQPDNEFAIIMSIANESGDVVTVIALETKVATKQDFYNAVLAEEGDRVVIDARWDIDLQAWVAYTVQLYSKS